MKITEKVSFNIASEVSLVYILSGQKFIKNTKNGSNGKFLKTLSLQSNSVTRQVNYKTFISWKVCGNPKNRTCGHPKNPRIQRKLCGLFHVANSSLNHSVWKSLKMSHSTLRATFTFWVDKSLLKMPKMVNFGEFLKP